jgi:hypothetical protein
MARITLIRAKVKTVILVPTPQLRGLIIIVFMISGRNGAAGLRSLGIELLRGRGSAEGIAVYAAWLGHQYETKTRMIADFF